jgi:hypothetical protein
MTTPPQIGPRFSHTWRMRREPESHRLDREAMLAEHVAIAERVKREVDVVLAAATAKRRTFLERFVDRLHIDARLERERYRISTAPRSAPTRADAPDRTHASRGALRDESVGVDATDSALDGVVAA